MSKEERIKEIRKAIKLVGWLEVSARVKSREDRAIFNELREESNASAREKADKILEQHQINF